MAITSVFCSLAASSMKILVVLLLIANTLDLLPKSVTFTKFEVTRPRCLNGILAVNGRLNNAERMFERQIKGPESFAVLDGELYTSLHGGFVARVTENKMEPVVRFGKDCKKWWEEDKCGRPLGLATTEDGHLIVADAYYGIFKLNPKTGGFKNLVANDVQIEDVIPKIFNDVTVAKDGTIYWTHSSSDFNLKDGLFSMLADPSGRLMKYDPVKRKSEVLLQKLYFANGVALSQDEDFVLVCETGSSKITRYHLKGPKKFQHDVFIDGLPGLPDNIRPNGKGGFLVSLNFPRDPNHAILSDYLAFIPFLRRTISRFLAFSDWSVSQIHKLYPNDFTEKLNFIIGHFEMLTPFFPNRTTVIELLENGEINDSFHGIDGSVRGISDVIAHNGYLWIGSPYNNYLGRIKLSKLDNKFVDTGKRLK